MSVCMYVCMHNLCIYICVCLCVCVCVYYVCVCVLCKLCMYVIYGIHFTDRLVAATHSFNVRKFNMTLIESLVIKID